MPYATDRCVPHALLKVSAARLDFSEGFSLPTVGKNPMFTPGAESLTAGGYFRPAARHSGYLGSNGREQLFVLYDGDCVFSTGQNQVVAGFLSLIHI